MDIIYVRREEMKEINIKALSSVSPEYKKEIFPYIKDSELEYIKTIHYLENECTKYTIRINKLFDALRKIQISSTGEIERIATVAIKEDNYLSME